MRRLKYRVYSGRSLLPPRHTDLKVRVLNADSKEQIIKKGTSLGSVSSVSTLDADIAPANERDDTGLSSVKEPDEVAVMDTLRRTGGRDASAQHH